MTWLLPLSVFSRFGRAAALSSTSFLFMARKVPVRGDAHTTVVCTFVMWWHVGCRQHLLLRIRLLWICFYKLLCGHVFSVLWGTWHLGVELLGPAPPSVEATVCHGPAGGSRPSFQRPRNWSGTPPCFGFISWVTDGEPLLLVST